MATPIIPDSVMAQLRATWLRTLDTTCVVKRGTKTQTSDGYQEETLATVATLAAKIVAPSQAMLLQFAGRIGTLQSFVVRFPYNADVRIGDTLVIAGQTLKVQAPLQPQSWSALTSVLATEVREGV